MAGRWPEQSSGFHTAAPVHLGDGAVDGPGPNAYLAGDLAQFAQ